MGRILDLPDGLADPFQIGIRDGDADLGHALPDFQFADCHNRTHSSYPSRFVCRLPGLHCRNFMLK